MREIKYRAWNRQTEKMIDLQKITPLAMDPKLLDLGTKGLFIPFDEQMILMQFTGRHDMYSKDCYEGDIIRMFRSLFVVKWDEWFGRFELELVKGDDLKKIHDIGGIDMNVIIGNIHESPELLKA